MSNRDTLRTILTNLTTQGADIEQTITQIFRTFPDIDDHEGERGYWNTSDEYGNINGPFDTRDEALRDGDGSYVYWVDAEDEDVED